MTTVSSQCLVALCSEYGLEEHAERIVSLAMPAARIEITPAADDGIPAGASRFGGTPDLPVGMIWPRTTTYRYMTFVLQISLAECTGMLDDAWPTDGWLHLFADVVDVPSGHDLRSFEKVCLMYTKEGTELRRCSHPTPIRNCDHDPNPMPVLNASKVGFEAIWSIPQREWGLARDASHSCLHTDGYAQLREKLMHQGAPNMYHQLGGYLTQHQEGAAWIAATRWHGIDSHNLPHRHPAKDRFNNMGHDWRLVVQLDGEGRLYEWLHSRRLYLMAHAPCVAAHTFDQYWPISDID